MSDNREKSIVLLSGGLDSVVSSACACEESDLCLALTFDYGQRAARKEIEAAHACCRVLGVSHRVIPLNWLAEVTKTALVDRAQKVPQMDLKDLATSGTEILETTRQVWVPNRNGLFINIAAAFAESLNASWIVTGLNREEGVAFPDNGPQFVETINNALKLSTLESVRVVSHTLHLTKAQIVQLGIEKNAPLHTVYSCYLGEELMCGTCESCVRLKRAFYSTGNWELIRDKFCGK
ncbi:MAG: 7-cyano-7-deazaguanine synthase QueC [Gemmatimonadota bacterium]|nr:MAG: 7-cyano-7-deazaguanine synthase QueC [Gemmatimonadota bacterium]